MNYFRFIRKEKRILSFGLSFSFLSSFGQTFFISLFVAYFLQDFSLTNSGFGSMYSAATLISAISLPYLGKWIDHIPLRRYSLYVLLAFVSAAIIMAVSWHIALLFVGILMLRISGQGLSSHIARTTMARYFQRRRGKALSIASLGYPIGEGILPLAVSGLLTLVIWRVAWVVVASVITFIFIPAVCFLLNKQKFTPDDEDTSKAAPRESSWPVYRMLFKDYRFWLVAPAILLPPFWVTGLFLYQVSIARQLSWSATLIASAFIGFAISRILSSLSVGPLIDRFSAESIAPFYLIPFGAGLLFAFYHPGSWSAFVYMIFVGITMGIGSNISSALWAEMYGTEVLGTVRSLFSSLKVFGTAMSPFLMGWAIDRSMAMENIIFIALITVCVATVMLFSAFFLPVFEDQRV